MFLKIMWFLIKWAFIIGVPIIIGLCFAGRNMLYSKHKTIHADKKTYITFDEFQKLYPVSADKWFFKCRFHQDYSLNSKSLILGGENLDIYCLYFNNDAPYSYSDAKYVYTQMIFKTARDFFKYLGWLEKREKAIKNHKKYEQEKADLKAMDEVLRIIQKDIDAMKEEADKKIQQSFDTTIEIAKRMEINEKGQLIENFGVEKKKKKVN